MDISTSVDISLLEVQVTFDISGPNPVISLVNKSIGSGLDNLTWWFIAKSPTDTPIHQGSETVPDYTEDWDTHTIADRWPRAFNNIEWSGAPYVIYIYVKDSAGKIFFIEKSASIKRPTGNCETTKNAYGLADVSVRVMCEKARIFFQDKTNAVYKGLTGNRISSILRVVYPLDETQSVPAPFQISNFSSALVPISYSSNNYQFIASSVYEYDYGNETYVRIKYQTADPKTGTGPTSFPVLCNVDLAPIASEIIKLTNSIEIGNCADVTDANRKLGLINSKFALVIIGKLEPLSGIDVPKLIDEIITIGGFDCDCCNAPTGIIPDYASVIDGYSFSIENDGGDVAGTVVKNGNNIQFVLHDKTYIFAVSSGAASAGFSAQNSLNVDGDVETYTLNIDKDQLATQLAAAIASSNTLVNIWNNLFNSNAEFNLTVDGGKIFQSSSACNYTFVLNDIPASGTFALLTQIKIGQEVRALNLLFNRASVADLQTYLNGLGAGTFAAVVSGTDINVTSNGNTFGLADLQYKIATNSFTADLTKICTGFVELSANTVIQNIIDYISGLDDSQVLTSDDYEICYIDENGEKQVLTVDKGVSESQFIKALLDANCKTVQSISASGGGVNCENITKLFAPTAAPIDNTTVLYGNKNGACAPVGVLDAFLFMLKNGVNNADIRKAFCDFASQCGQGLTCVPYDYLEVLVTPYSTTCAPITGIQYTIT